MIPVSLQAVALAVNGQLIGADTQISDVVTDTRKLTDGCLFIALKVKNSMPMTLLRMP